MHRDLKPENILLHNDGVLKVKLADFTCATQTGEARKTICGSLTVMAPELIVRHVEQKESYCEYGTEVDVWNLGVVFY